MVRTSVTHSAIASCVTFLFLVHFDVSCDLLLNVRSATWKNSARLSVLNLMAGFCQYIRTEWSPIWSVMMRVITKSGARKAGVRFVYHEYDYGPNWTTRSLITN